MTTRVTDEQIEAGQKAAANGFGRAAYAIDKKLVSEIYLAMRALEPQGDITREKVAREIAAALGDDFDKAHDSKSHWIEDRGGEPFRDVNAPFKPDYLAAADAAIAAIGEQE